MIENMIPLLVCIGAMVYQKDWSNQAAVSWFGVFYLAAFVITGVWGNAPEYFVASIITTPLFLLAIASLNKFTIMMSFLWLTEIIMALIDLGGFTAYNLQREQLYTMRLTPERLVIALQLAALLVIDGRSVNMHTIRDDLVSLFRSSAAYFSLVEAINSVFKKTQTARQWRN